MGKQSKTKTPRPQTTSAAGDNQYANPYPNTYDGMLEVFRRRRRLEPPPPACANCGAAPAAGTALLHCGACKPVKYVGAMPSVPDENSPFVVTDLGSLLWRASRAGVHYCDRECQRAHWKGHKPQCKAIRAERAKGVSRVLKWTRDKDISWAAGSGDLDAVRLLVAVGADPGQVSSDGYPPLYNASCEPHGDRLAIMGFLLDVGADIDQRNNNGCTAMYVAAQNGNVQGLRLLVSRGGDIHLAKNNGAWPAFIACQTGHLEAVRFLVAQGAVLDQTMNDGALPTYIAGQEGHTHVLRYLMDQKIELHRPRLDGATATYAASSHGHLETTRFLIDNGADVDHPMNDGCTPLFIAAQYGYREIVRLLADAGADVDRENLSGTTPLQIAAVGGNIEVVRLLARCGALYRKCHRQGMTALDYAIRYNQHDIVRLLTDIDSAGGWRPYAAARRMAYVRIRHEVSKTYAVLDERHEDRELLHLVFGRNRAAADAVGSHSKRLEEAANDGAEKLKAMLELPDVVFRLVCRYLE